MKKYQLTKCSEDSTCVRSIWKYTSRLPLDGGLTSLSYLQLSVNFFTNSSCVNASILEMLYNSGQFTSSWKNGSVDIGGVLASVLFISDSNAGDTVTDDSVDFSNETTVDVSSSFIVLFVLSVELNSIVGEGRVDCRWFDTFVKISVNCDFANGIFWIILLPDAVEVDIFIIVDALKIIRSIKDINKLTLFL